MDRLLVVLAAIAPHGEFPGGDEGHWSRLCGVDWHGAEFRRAGGRGASRGVATTAEPGNHEPEQCGENTHEERNCAPRLSPIHNHFIQTGDLHAFIVSRLRGEVGWGATRRAYGGVEGVRWKPGAGRQEILLQQVVRN